MVKKFLEDEELVKSLIGFVVIALLFLLASIISYFEYSAY